MRFLAVAVALTVVAACGSSVGDSGTGTASIAMVTTTASVPSPELPPSSSSSSIPSTTIVVSTSSTISIATALSSSTSSTPSAPPSTAGQPEIVTLSIPLGTAARIVAGDDVGNVLPPSLALSVGDQLVIVNNDDAFHTYGPLSARPGETVRYEFAQRGSYQGLCTTNSSRVVTIEVS